MTILVRRPGVAVFFASFLTMLVESNSHSLFGRSSIGGVLDSWSLVPFHQTNFVTLLTYSFVHMDWSHWLSSGLMWLVGSLTWESTLPLPVKPRALLACVIYGFVMFGIGLSFYLPLAPPADANDRVFGLSAMAIFAITASCATRRSRLADLFAIGLVLSLWLGPTLPPLVHWGHGSGCFMGLIVALVLRYYWKVTKQSFE